ncbi:MAG TPA: YihY/virulence factor BrkB family protein [Solirubrobacteraceae bacterium]|jgi:YihY family inner membrane protein|nr:YihY/virulence factor BrkB family protein [Solirubrobacteraceae bacterium]
MSLGERLRALDRRQQQSRHSAFVAAVIKKYGEDQAGQLAALIAYYGFVSLFPLLLVFVTVLGFVLQGNPSAQNSVLHSTLHQFPIIGTQLQDNVHSLTGSGVSLAIGLAGSLLAGLGITSASQNAFNRVWSVPHKHRPNFLIARLRGLGVLFALGTLVILSTVAAAFVTAGGQGILAILGGVLVALIVNLLLFFAAFRLLSTERVETRDLLPGVVVAALLWTLLQHVGGYYVDHVVRHAKETSGLFAFVLGLLAWLYLGAQVTIVAAEVNVVKARRLWPRSFFSDPLLEADRRALTFSAEIEERVEEEQVDVSFDPSPSPPADRQPTPPHAGSE